MAQGQKRKRWSPLDLEIVIALPFTALETAARLVSGSELRLAAQNLPTING